MKVQSSPPLFKPFQVILGKLLSQVFYTVCTVRRAESNTAEHTAGNCLTFNGRIYINTGRVYEVRDNHKKVMSGLMECWFL